MLRSMSQFPRHLILVRLPDILAPKGPLPVSESSWWAGIKAGKFPRQIKLSSRVAVWRASDIDALIEKLVADKNEAGNA